MKAGKPLIAATVSVALACSVAAAALAPGEFAWRARLELPAGASMVRVELPPEALLRLQSEDGRDLRVFNAAGDAVPFTLGRPATPTASSAPESTASYAAFPLLAGRPGKAPAPGTLSVRIDDSGGPRTVWVRMDRAGTVAGAAARVPDGASLPSAIFSTGAEKQNLGAITVQAELPANQPVRVTAATSSDLSQWTPLPLRGRLYRFEGPGAPVNERLEFEQPQRLQGRYLRLDWQGHEGVKVASIKGEVAPAQAPPKLLRAPLPAPTQAGPAALEWRLDFSTPVAALALSTSRPNTLVPVRVLGRTVAGQPWRQIGQTVLYRLGQAGAESSNGALALNQSLRWLRVEASHAMELDAATVQATAEFQPVQVVFIATGATPFTLAAGRTQTPSVALPSATFSSAMPGNLDLLPKAAITSVESAKAEDGTGWISRLPGGFSGRDLALWGALLGGVLLLGAVAFTLLRQLKAAGPGTGPDGR
jgi:hypothetical protein